MPLMKNPVIGVAALAAGAALFFSPAEAASPSFVASDAGARLAEAAGASALANTRALFALRAERGGSRNADRGQRGGRRGGRKDSGRRESGRSSERRPDSRGGNSGDGSRTADRSGERRESGRENGRSERRSDNRKGDGGGGDRGRSADNRRDGGRTGDRRYDGRRGSDDHRRNDDRRRYDARRRYDDRNRSYARRPGYRSYGYSHGRAPHRGHGYYCNEHHTFHYYAGYDPYGWVFAVHVGYYPPYGCRTVERVVYRGYRRIVYGAVQCIDEWGYPYIVRGSEYVYRTY
jgi:hypothetical protein